jgi:hypothetical protein
LVKDGALAIRTLGSAIDTSMNTALGTKKAGMVLLNTTSFSGVSSQSVNDVFSATYNNYLIVIDDLIKSASGGAGDIYLRLRVSGTDSTTGYYWGQQYSLFAADTAGTGRLNNGSYFSAVGSNSDTVKVYSQNWLQNPFLTKLTGFQSIQTRHDASAYSAGYNSAATSYTGFSIVAAANNMSGTVTTYGFNK